MTGVVLWWSFLNIFFLVMLAFYSMMEMACVSFNKVRLQYYVSNGQYRAIWINYLMQHSSIFFGTTLIGVNVALMAGSECARQLYVSLNLDPDLAPLTQVLIVVIFGELAPMFAARRYAEHVALLGIPLLYATAKIMTPFLWVLKYLINFFNKLVGAKEAETNLFLTQEELIHMLEEQEEDRITGGDNSEFNQVASQIFNLRNREATQLMEPLDAISLFPSTSTVGNIRNALRKNKQLYIPIYHRERSNVVAIAFPQDLIGLSNTQSARDHAQSPWFVTQKTHVLQILKQFRKNDQHVAVILNVAGQAVGLLTLDHIMAEIFGTSRQGDQVKEREPSYQFVVVDRTIPGDMTIAEFKAEFKTDIIGNNEQTVSELIIEQLGHVPAVNELVFIKPFEWVIKEATLMAVKSVSVRTRIS